MNCTLEVPVSDYKRSVAWLVQREMAPSKTLTCSWMNSFFWTLSYPISSLRADSKNVSTAPEPVLCKLSAGKGSSEKLLNVKHSMQGTFWVNMMCAFVHFFSMGYYIITRLSKISQGIMIAIQPSPCLDDMCLKSAGWCASGEINCAIKNC